MSIARLTRRGVAAAALALAATPLLATAAFAGGSAPNSPVLNGTLGSHNRALTATWTESSTGTITYKATAVSTVKGDITRFCITRNLSCTIYGLVNNHLYNVTVVASNASGHSAPSNSVPGVPGAPSRPLSVHATIGEGSSVVSWAPPIASGIAAISGYTVTATGAGGPFSCSSSATPPAVPARHCTLHGLTNNAKYGITVTASNKIGTGPASRTFWVTVS